MLDDRRHLIAELRANITAKLTPYVDQDEDFALLDFPHHSNVGDSAIWLGEMAYFRAMKKSPRFVAEINNFELDDLRQALPRGTIYLHGGGNLGDIWPAHQKFREKIISSFPDRLIVQLPQTIHYSDLDALHESAEIISGHDHFVLMVRDQQSYDIATQTFDTNVLLVPDMAFYIGMRNRSTPPEIPLLLLLRTDKERRHSGNLPPLPDGAHMADWLDEDQNLSAALKHLTMLTSFLDLGIGAFKKSKQRILLFENLAKHRFQRGVDLLSSAEFVITDRLHVHILCLLLGIPHITLDNSYGKLSRFMDTWTNGINDVDRAHSLPEAIEKWSKKAT